MATLHSQRHTVFPDSLSTPGEEFLEANVHSERHPRYLLRLPTRSALTSAVMIECG